MLTFKKPKDINKYFAKDPFAKVEVYSLFYKKRGYATNPLTEKDIRKLAIVKVYGVKNN